MPGRHSVRSAKLDLELTGEPLVHAPAHALPIEYLEGPYRYHGTMGGKPVTGVALFESSDPMYRDWELIEVLATQITAGHAESEALTMAFDEARTHIARRDNPATLDFLDRQVRPLLLRYPAYLLTWPVTAYAPGEPCRCRAKRREVTHQSPAAAALAPADQAPGCNRIGSFTVSRSSVDAPIWTRRAPGSQASGATPR